MIFLFGFGCCFSRTDTTGGQRRETPIAGSLHAGSDQSKKKKTYLKKERKKFLLKQCARKKKILNSDRILTEF